MKFLTHRDGVQLPSGTFRCGSIQASFLQLTMAFGEPRTFSKTEADGESMSASWVLLFADGSHAEVYDYKRSNEGTTGPVTWSIGAMSRKAVDNVHAAFRGHLTSLLEFPKIAAFVDNVPANLASAEVVDSEGGHAD
jgi:hypothetical protein